MVQANRQNKPLSELFQSAYLRQVFAAVERDLPPEALGVAIEPVAPLAPGAVAELVEG